ncbi:MAG TPA: MotA/TolQ/ExbB proton channel family protein [Pirellulales bacterium]|nr:MotA/TolQ/ExbB proton channel family protein [Pirellulales bacterium]
MFAIRAAPNSKSGAAITNHWLMVFVCAAIVALCAAPSRAQQDEPPEQPAEQAADADRLAEAERRAEEALNEPSEKPAEPAPLPAPKLPSMNLLELAISGGALMVPIALMSFVVVLFAIERWLGLRRRKIIPPGLVAALGQLAGRPGGLDPKQAYKLCQQFPSTTASVLRAVLLKVGRPHSEVEFAMKEASEREAAKLYKNVRPIELAITITPLLGLLGTVQGMIQAFFITANMPTNVNKAESLAGGIYVALVTTFAGLTVAIPAAMLAHYFEGRIQSLFRDVDELLLGLLPQLERFEGKLRVQRPASAAPESEPPGDKPRAEAQPAVSRK